MGGWIKSICRWPWGDNSSTRSGSLPEPAPEGADLRRGAGLGQGGLNNEAGKSPAVMEMADGGQSDRRNAG